MNPSLRSGFIFISFRIIYDTCFSVIGTVSPLTYDDVVTRLLIGPSLGAGRSPVAIGGHSNFALGSILVVSLWDQHYDLVRLQPVSISTIQEDPFASVAAHS